MPLVFLPPPSLPRRTQLSPNFTLSSVRLHIIVSTEPPELTHGVETCLDAAKVERVSESASFGVLATVLRLTIFNRGGAKRHRKILRDNIQGITKPVSIRIM